MMRKNNTTFNTKLNYGSGAGYRGTTKGNGKGGAESAYVNQYGYGDGYDHSHGNTSTNGKRYGAGFENSRCTRLLTDDYPDINFYICQLQLLKGRSP